MKARLLSVPPSPPFRQLRGETTEVPPVDSAPHGRDATSRRVYERGCMYEGLGTGSQPRTWDYASERSAAKSHVRDGWRQQGLGRPKWAVAPAWANRREPVGAVVRAAKSFQSRVDRNRQESSCNEWRFARDLHAYGKLPIGASRHTGTLDSRRFLPTPVDSACAGLGAGGTRRAVASTSGAACTRGSVRAHSRISGITPRSVPQRNPACGCPRADTLDSCRFPSTPVDSAPHGLGTRGTRRAVAPTSGAACTRGSVRAHCRADGITPRNVPQRNPACGMAGGNRVWAGPNGRSRRPGRIDVSRLVQS